MEIKGILEKIRQKETKKKEFFFALEISPELVKSAIWAIVETQVKVFAIGDAQAWGNEEDLVQAVDTSLSSAVQKFVPPEELTEPNKVVLGLPGDWIVEDKILADKSELIKKVSHSLDLNPIGFVVINEAIIHHLKTVEGVPPTVIIVGLGEKKLTVCLVKLGKIIDTKLVERSENLGADLNEGLTRFGDQEAFPARILLFGKERLEEARQELVNYPWQKELVNFLHLPKIEILTSDFDIQSIALAGGKEISQGQVKSFSLEVRAEKLETMGFVEGKDITEEKAMPTPIEQKIPEVIPNPKGLKMPKINLRLIFSHLPRLPKIKLNFSGRLMPIVGLILGFLVIFGGAAFAFWWYLPKAQIVLYIKSQVLEKDFLIKLDPSAQQADSEKLILPAHKLEMEAGGEKTTSTTGIKLVGEPARGKVTIYKVPGAEKKFPAGTVVTSSSGIKFSLDEEVLIASRSSAADPTPSKVVAVTAEKIGPEGNYSAGSEFSIANFAKSDYVAKNESAFSGGSSREIQAVSKIDQEKLAEDLAGELKKKGAQDLKSKIGSQEKLIEESLNSKIIEKTFSKELEAEANELSLKMKMKVSALSFSEDEFTKIIREQVEKSVPEGFEYKSEESKTDFSLKEITKDGIAVFNAHYKTNLLPILDLENIKKNLSGKYLEIGKAYLSNLPNIDSLEVKITPSLPLKIKTFPRVVKNIKIEVLGR